MKARIVKIALMSLLIGILGITLPSIYCQTSAPSGVEPKYGGTFIYAIYSDPGIINPTLTTSFNVGQSAGPVYEALTYDSRDPGFPPKPCLAESWEESNGAKTWTFNLVHNVTWHDGVNFTSADVKFTVEEMLVPYHPGGKTIWKNLNAVETPDDYTVVFKFEEPIAPLPTYCSDMWCTVLPKHLWEGTDFQENPYNQKPVGTGPFIFEEYQKGEYISYVKNENYWKKGKPYLDKVIIKIIPDETMRGIAFERGEIHYMASFIAPYAVVDRLTGRSGVYVSTDLWNEQLGNYMVVNMGNPESPTSNKLVRQALSYAMDKQRFSELVTYGFDKPATSHYQSIAWCYNPNVKQYPYNTTKAEELLDQAGYMKGSDGIRFTLKLRSSTDDTGRKKAEVTADMLSDVGIKCDMQLLEYLAHKTAMFVTGDYDIGYITGYTTGPDPMIVAKVFISTSVFDPPIPFTNTAKYNNSRIDELYEQGIATGDIAERTAIYNEIQEILMEDLPYIPITEANYPQICSTDFVSVPPSGKGPRAGLENVWWVWGEPAEASEVMIRIAALEAAVGDLSTKLDMLTNVTYAAIIIPVIAIIGAAAILLKRKPMK